MRALVRDPGGSVVRNPAVVYDGADLDLSDGVAVRNVRSFVL